MFHRKKKAKVGLIYGAFDPFHHGHSNVIEQALLFCDQLYIIVRNNDLTHDSTIHLPTAKRVKLINDIMKNENVHAVEGHQALSKPHNLHSRKSYGEYLRSQLPPKTSIDYYFTHSHDEQHIAAALRATPVVIDPNHNMFPITSEMIRKNFDQYALAMPKAVKELYSRELTSEKQR